MAGWIDGWVGFTEFTLFTNFLPQRHGDTEGKRMTRWQKLPDETVKDSKTYHRKFEKKSRVIPIPVRDCTFPESIGLLTPGRTSAWHHSPFGGERKSREQLVQLQTANGIRSQRPEFSVRMERRMV